LFVTLGFDIVIYLELVILDLVLVINTAKIKLIKIDLIMALLNLN